MEMNKINYFLNTRSGQLKYTPIIISLKSFDSGMFPFNKKYITALVHTIIWLCLFFYPFIFHYTPIEDFRAVLRIALFLILLMAFFYSNTHILIPKILGRKKVILYLLIIVSIIIVIGFLAGYIQVFLNPEYAKKPAMYDRAFNTGIICSILTLVISSSIKVTTEWFRNQQLMKSAENEKLNAELNFLKSQVNPHFVFNALNNIYSLENKKSPDTGPAILKLSDLIRYMLYETRAEFVPLEREFDYLENYIELQKLGLSKEVDIKFKIEGDYADKKIRPMLLIPLVENIFKHGISYLHNTNLVILVKISGDRLEIITKNPVNENGSGINKNEGIGLTNLKKRLHLLYRDKHELNITNENGTFTAHLKLSLK